MGLKQVEFAKMVGLGLKTLRKIEQGDLSVNFNKLNYLLNCLGLYLRPQELVTSPVSKNTEIPSTEVVLEKLRHVYQIFKIKYGVEELSLFGSYAKGVADIGSDIDILISFNRDVDLEIEGEIQLILENIFNGIKVDLVLANNLHSGLKEEIERSKINVTKKV